MGIDIWTLYEKAKELLDAVEFLGKARAASDASASGDFEYDGTDGRWRDYVEPCLLEPYDALLAATQNTDNTE